MALTQRILVVGAGSIGRRHARLLQQRDDMAVEVCEPSADTLKLALEELGDVPAYDSFNAALASKPDLVVIATPHGLHGDQTVRALESGAHVLCEKPISDSVEDARRMADAAKATGRILSIGFHMHFHPGVLRMKEILAAGTIGRVVHFHCRVGSYITLVNSGSRYQEQLEGALLMDYTHQPDLLYWLLGKRPAGVHMTGVQAGNIELTSNPNALSLTLDYDEPMIATVHLNYLQMPERHEYEIVGDRGWLHWNMKTGELRIGDRDSDMERVEQVSVERDPIYVAEHQTFLDAVAGKGSPQSPPDEATVSLEIVLAAMASWREGARIPL